MQTSYILIDYENVPAAALDLLKGDHFQVRVFLGPHNAKLPADFAMAMQELRERGDYVKLKRPGPNALDLQVAYYLGGLVKADPAGLFHIISKDKGFDPLIQHLGQQGIAIVRSESIEAMPCFRRKAKPLEADGKATKEELLTIVIEDLTKRKGHRPRKAKALLNTIHARCGKELPSSTITGVYEALITRGFVKVEGANVSYDLPS